jgi:recombination protein RecR
VERVRQEKPAEVIIAFDAEVENEATAPYSSEQLQPLGVAVTRIGLGLPAGSALEAADEVTLTSARDGRRKYN